MVDIIEVVDPALVDETDTVGVDSALVDAVDLDLVDFKVDIARK